MANWADVRAALAHWFKIPDYQAEALLGRVTPTLDVREILADFGSTAAPRAAMHSANQAGVAAEKSRVQLMNPANTGIDIHILGLTSSQATSGTRTLGFVNTAVATACVNRYIDQRIGISPETFLVKHPAGVMTRDTDAANGILAADTIEEQTMLVTTTRTNFLRPIILPPGFGFRAVCETVNLQFRVTMYTLEVARKIA